MFTAGVPAWRARALPVRRIAVFYNDGQTAEQIHEAFPHLALDHIYAAIAYYLANREEIDADLAADASESGHMVDEWERERRAEPRG